MIPKITLWALRIIVCPLLKHQKCRSKRRSSSQLRKIREMIWIIRMKTNNVFVMIQRRTWKTISAKKREMMMEELSTMRAWTEKIQAKWMTTAKKMIKLKIRRRRFLQTRNKVKRISKNRTRSAKSNRFLKRNRRWRKKSHRFQEHRGAKRKRKKNRQRRLRRKRNQKRTIKYWHRCRLTGKKRRRPSSTQTLNMTHSLCMIAQQQISDFWKCSRLQNTSTYPRLSKLLTPSWKFMGLNLIISGQRVNLLQKRKKYKNI